MPHTSYYLYMLDFILKAQLIRINKRFKYNKLVRGHKSKKSNYWKSVMRFPEQLVIKYNYSIFHKRF